MTRTRKHLLAAIALTTTLAAGCSTTNDQNTSGQNNTQPAAADLTYIDGTPGSIADDTQLLWFWAPT